MQSLTYSKSVSRREALGNVGKVVVSVSGPMKSLVELGHNVMSPIKSQESVPSGQWILTNMICMTVTPEDRFDTFKADIAIVQLGHNILLNNDCIE